MLMCWRSQCPERGLLLLRCDILPDAARLVRSVEQVSRASLERVRIYCNSVEIRKKSMSFGSWVLYALRTVLADRRKRAGEC